MNQPEQVLWKFALNTDGTEQRYEWPYLVHILSIQMQDNIPVMWAIVYPHTAKRTYKVMRFLTGERVYGVNAHLGTVQLPTGDVLHYFSGGPGL